MDDTVVVLGALHVRPAYDAVQTQIKLFIYL
jgi:hypothetical protein